MNMTIDSDWKRKRGNNETEPPAAGPTSTTEQGKAESDRDIDDTER